MGSPGSVRESLTGRSEMSVPRAVTVQVTLRAEIPNPEDDLFEAAFRVFRHFTPPECFLGRATVQQTSVWENRQATLEHPPATA